MPETQHCCICETAFRTKGWTIVFSNLVDVSFCAKCDRTPLAKKIADEAKKICDEFGADEIWQRLPEIIAREKAAASY